MTTDFDIARRHKDRIEGEYDALIVRLNTAQGELSGKAVKVNELGPGQYRLWLANAKSQVQKIQADIAVKKVERSEARRHFNGWEPSNAIEGWVDEPDCDGWWWFHGEAPVLGDDGVEEWDETTEPVEITIDLDGKLHVDGMDRDKFENYRGKWRFLPLPDLP